VRKIIDLIFGFYFNGFYVALFGALIAMILSIIAIFGKKEKMRVKLFIGAFACMAEACFASVVITFASGNLDGGLTIVSLGLFGFQMFMLAENIITDSHIDNGDKKYRKYRILPIISSLLIFALIAWAMYPSGENLIVVVILLWPHIPIFYFCTKHLIFPDKRPKPKSFIMHFVPFEMAFYVTDLLCYAFWYHKNYTMTIVMGNLEVIPLIAMGVVIFKQFRRDEE